MSKGFLILQKDMLEFFSNTANLVSVFVFYLVLWLFLWVFPVSSYMQYGYTDPTLYFNLLSYLILLMAPAISTLLMSIEYKSGTLELYKLAKISWFEFLVAKMTAGILICFALVFISMIHLRILNDLQMISSELINWRQIGYLLFAYSLVSAVFISLSVLISVRIDHPVGVLIASVLACFLFFYGFDYISDLFSDSARQFLRVRKFGILYHQDLMAKGIIRMSSLFYLLMLMLVFNYLSYLLISRKKI